MYEVEQYSKYMLDEAIHRKVTDIHIVPEDKHCVIMVRFNGRIQNWKSIPIKLAERIISHFKYRSGMDIGESRKPQSASMLYKNKKVTYSLRFSTLPTRNKESLAIRILPNVTFHSFSSLCVLRNQVRDLQELSSLSYGLCLVSGPTGSGKTTTLYSLVEYMMKQGGKTIITIEDPVERFISNTIQIEVNLKTGVTFDSALSASLRHDPDVLLIGEIRDEATAKLAIRAALTGHLVIATVHADDCHSVLLRMKNLGVSELDLMQCCKVILSQRIVQTKCRLCMGECHPSCVKDRLMARAAIFEVLKGLELKQSLKTGRNTGSKPFLKEIKKAWALGYIEENEVERYVSYYF
ncbi:late competence protein [Halalkalibacter wakoensis JCM 9140]|uniref:Late competence protein n=1 Tax=Halalkalibacter wakoensis JCM 9140 TaxID=1236970 RepID=W4PZQ9_9BACI|nr:competence type IV pilus ATPase ComGA [Halalkalibacter wakoensis]GAE25331.1 late competence protein [Halalkalibacter wakoensis JCM 9140]